MATPACVSGASAPVPVLAGIRSRSSTAFKFAPLTGGIAGSQAGGGNVGAEANAYGAARLGKKFNASTVMLSAVATAVTFARNNVRARTGKGASTNTSRRSGNMDSQLNTANNPTTSM